MRHRLLVLILAALLGFSAAPAAAHAQDDKAIAVNTKDGSSVFKLAFHIRLVADDVVDQGNAAVAYASCEACRTIAIAIQVVLVFGTPTTVTPTNLALAINENCTLCETLATAYQFVIGTGDRMRFTGDGRRELAEIKKALRDLGKSDLSIVEIQQRVSELMVRLRDVLATELVPVAPGEEDESEESDVDEEEKPVATSPTGPQSQTTTGGTTTLETSPATTSPTTAPPAADTTTTEQTPTTDATTTQTTEATTTTTTSTGTTETTP